MVDEQTPLRPSRLSVLGFCLLAAVIAVAGILATVARADSFSLSVDTLGQGSVQKSAEPPYSDGQTVILTATADTGWEFVSWTADSDTQWWNLSYNYRISVTVDADGYQRNDKAAEAMLDFTQLLADLGKSGSLDVNSIRVVEVDSGGDVIDDSVPFQFDAAADFDAAIKAAGTVVWVMEGTTGKNTTRIFHIYFDVTGKGFATPSVTPLVTLTQNVGDAGKLSHKIDMAGQTYYYHQSGAGFSSLDDADGNDWINYSTNEPSRGIPNLVHPNNGGHFHPGINSSTTTVVSEGPVKVKLHSKGKKSVTKCWETVWEFYPGYARQTVLSKCYDYWWLYEGTPGGELDVNSDYMVLSDGTQYLAKDSWEEDLEGDEWVYFVDPDLSRALFLINHSDDDKTDSYAPTNDKKMTKFGFGRTGAAYLLEQIPAQFTFGLMDETIYTDSARIINNAFQPLAIQPGQPEERAGANLGNQNPLPFTIEGTHLLTATFALQQFALTLDQTGQGSVSATPDNPTYEYNEMVEVKADAAPGWIFIEWLGDLTGSVNPASITMTADRQVTASFLPAFDVNTSTSGKGAIILDPSGGRYPQGQNLKVEAVGDPGWEFTGWGGDLSGNINPLTIAITRNLSITAAFDPASYTVTLNATGNGLVAREPDQPSYSFGDVLTLTATAAAGWVFDGWTGDLISPDNPALLSVTQDLIITGQFSLPADHDLDVTTAGQGSVQRDPDKPAYSEGEMVTLTATPANGWDFAGWSGDLTGTTNPAEIKMDGDKAVTAIFTTPAALFTDAFATCQLDNGWTFINPLGDGSVKVDGSHLVINVPGGTNHDVWLGGNRAPRVMQPATDTNFQLVALFDSTVTERFQMQGFIVEQDSDNFLRFDLFSTGSKTKVFAARFSAGVPTQVFSVDVEGAGDSALRLTRKGDNWKLETGNGDGGWTLHGQFDHQLIVAQVGLFAGNTNKIAGQEPAHTAEVDYFYNTADPEDKKDASLLTLTSDGRGNISVDPQNEHYKCGQTVTLSPIPALGWTFTNWSGDASGSTDLITIKLDEPQAVQANFVFGSAGGPFQLAVPLVVKP